MYLPMTNQVSFTLSISLGILSRIDKEGSSSIYLILSMFFILLGFGAYYVKLTHTSYFILASMLSLSSNVWAYSLKIPI